ncbi:Hypothetical predicted protein [Xyrichtys novacula]|uniref:Uncharacterized protein n=1 Tax=Xyrichtys novacula TaxID=13765 RepID=A0AAV1F2A9_XYRNO|nr:Hypothetical predicted protein [Xyrichtys novacula]
MRPQVDVAGVDLLRMSEGVLVSDQASWALEVFLGDQKRAADLTINLRVHQQSSSGKSREFCTKLPAKNPVPDVLEVQASTYRENSTCHQSLATMLVAHLFLLSAPISCLSLVVVHCNKGT